MRAVRGSTIVFAALLAAVGTATAAVVVYSPHARIIPVVLGVFGYTYGSLLGVFLLGLTTKNRGNDFGNVVGMIWWLHRRGDPERSAVGPRERRRGIDPQSFNRRHGSCRSSFPGG